MDQLPPKGITVGEGSRLLWELVKDCYPYELEYGIHVGFVLGETPTDEDGLAWFLISAVDKLWLGDDYLEACRRITEEIW